MDLREVDSKSHFFFFFHRGPDFLFGGRCPICGVDCAAGNRQQARKSLLASGPGDESSFALNARIAELVNEVGHRGNSSEQETWGQRGRAPLPLTLYMATTFDGTCLLRW